MAQVHEILNSLGYRLRDEGKWYRTAALYRGGGNQSCLAVRKDNGSFKDFKTGQTGSFRELIYLTAGDEAEKYLEDFDASNHLLNPPQPEIVKRISYDRSILHKLYPKWDLYINDGISEKTMREFEVGYKAEDHLFKRYCFPIYDEKGAIIGFAGRHETKEVPDGVPKWKLHGHKKEWLWPLHVNACDIDEAQEVILVESPNCVFHLWEAGIKNVVCLFGIEISPAVFKYLIKTQPKKVIIATNNDAADNGYAGQTAAKKIREALSTFFSEQRLPICLPTRKDFGMMNTEEILTWKANLNNERSCDLY